MTPPRKRRSRTPKKGMDDAMKQGQVKAASQGARNDVGSQRGEPGFGTGSSAMGRVKAQSEEGQLVKCSECGFSGGRHLRQCSRASA